MIAQEVMSLNPVTIGTKDSLYHALDLMREHSVRHLPVLDKNQLTGIITESDIRGAFLGKSNGKYHPRDPSQMKVADHMTQDPLTISPLTHVEDAALLIYKNKIGAVPVIENNALVGILSIMDILGLFIDMMGILHSSSRLDVVMDKDPKSFEEVSEIINQRGLSIISVGIIPHKEDRNKQVYIFRLDLCQTAQVVEKITEAGFKVLSAMD